MYPYEPWGAGAFLVSLQTLWLRFAAFVPQLIIAVVVLIIGWIIAAVLSGIVRRVFEKLRIDDALTRSSVVQRLRTQGHQISIARAAAWVVKWFILLLTLMTVSSGLGMSQINEFLNDVAHYIPNIFVAVVILAVGLVVGGFLEDVVRTAVIASRLPNASAGALSIVAKWSVIIFALLAALVQLGIAPSLIQILLTGFVAMIALAGGLAFGLGGKDKAAQWLDRLEKDLANMETR